AGTAILVRRSEQGRTPLYGDHTGARRVVRLDIGIVIAGLLATGCGDCTRGDVPRVEDASSLGSATLSVEELVDARMERIQRLRTSCVPEHWPTLVLMATNRY